jgi:chromosome segregation ATPase
MLQKYGISNLNGTTNDIKKLLEQYNFIENEDFELRKVSQLRTQGGTSIKNEYYLHPRSFKICLMRSLKTKKYAKYYLLLEECIKYYNDYQDKLKEKYIIKLKNKIEKKEHKICSLEEKIDKLLENNKKILEDNKETKIMNEKLLENNKEIIKRSKKMESQLNETLDKLDITNDKLDDATEELEDVNERLDTTDKNLINVAKKLDIAVEDRVMKTKRLSTLEYFIIMKNTINEYKYYIIRGQKRYINKKMEQLEGYTQIKRLEQVPNASILWNYIKEELKDNIDYCGNKLNLINFNQLDFLRNIDEIYNKRKNIIL